MTSHDSCQPRADNDPAESAQVQAPPASGDEVDHGGSSNTVEQPATGSLWPLVAAAAAYAIIVYVVDAWVTPSVRVSIWDLQDSAELGDWLLRLLWSGLLQVLRFLPAGLLVWLLAAGCFPQREGSRRLVRLVSGCFRGLFALAATCAFAALVLGIALGRVPPLALLVLPMLGGAVGIALGWAWQRGRRSHSWLARQLMLLIVAGVAGLAAFVWLALEPHALPFEPAEVTSEHKRHLVALVQRSSRAKDDRQLHLTEDDANVLLAWGLSLGSPHRKARVWFGDEQVRAEASLGLPVGSRRTYLNIRAAGGADVVKGRLRTRVDRLHVGRMPVPAGLVNLLFPLLIDALRHDPDAEPVLSAIREFRPASGGLEIAVRRGDFTNRVLPSLLARMGDHPDVRAAAAEHFQHLAAASAHLPAGDAGFEAYLRTAFAFAQERSVDGEAISENRAAIYALAILLGHPRVEQFVGPVTSVESWRLTRQAPGPVSLRGRRDWTQHFWVSAALALLSSEAASNAVGLLKEELDAAGPSGFSFSDLLADRAGTLFALAATQDEQSARRMQQRMTQAFDLDDLFPHAADLPEGISDADLQQQYGGVDGHRFRQITAEIERRLADCAALGPGRP